MFQLNLTRPATYDLYGQPCYLVSQEKGLIQFQENHLIEGALADGYTQTVAVKLFNIIKKCVEREAKARPIDIMEVGGGRGNYYEYVKTAVRTFLNLEPGHIKLSGRALERLKDPCYMTLKCSAESIPLPNESFDVVLSIASLDHIPDYSKALAEISRLLRPNGLFIMTLNNRRSWWKTLLSGTDYLKRREAEIAKEHYFQWSFSECEAILGRYFSIQRMYTTTFLPFVPKVWRLILPIADLLGEAAFKKSGANIVTLCRKSDISRE